MGGSRSHLDFFVWKIERGALKKSQCIITTFLIRKHTAAIDPLPKCTMCTLVKMITIPEDP